MRFITDLDHSAEIVKASKYMKVRDPFALQLYDYSKNLCVGCNFIDKYKEVCSVFAYTYKDIVAYGQERYRGYKINLDNCTCSTCMVKVNCTSICNPFAQFYTKKRAELTAIEYEIEGVKKALQIIVGTNQINKVRKGYFVELKCLQFGDKFNGRPFIIEHKLDGKGKKFYSVDV